MEAYTLKERKFSDYERKIEAYFIPEDYIELFEKKVLELVLNGNIVELQNIIKHDFVIEYGNKKSKWEILNNLMSKEYIKGIISVCTIIKISNVSECYNILDTVPIITEKGKEELKRLKKIYRG